MFSKKSRCQYRNNQLAEVICQLRFPEILAINANQPADFQEAIRGEFPIYSTTVEASTPKISGIPGNLQIQNEPAIVNHQFSTVDGVWRVNMTSKFISLACNRYTRWEDFAKRLDKPLAAFISIYKPVHFERIGLRYLNFISRESLDLENHPFCDLITPCYLGLLNDDDIDESMALRNGVDSEIKLTDGVRLKIHAGPGLVKQNGQQQKEIRFIFDQDLYIAGSISVNRSVNALDMLHSHAFPVFRGAITELLHEAMEPMAIS